MLIKENETFNLQLKGNKLILTGKMDDHPDVARKFCEMRQHLEFEGQNFIVIDASNALITEVGVTNFIATFVKLLFEPVFHCLDSYLAEVLMLDKRIAGIDFSFDIETKRILTCTEFSSTKFRGSPCYDCKETGRGKVIVQHYGTFVPAGRIGKFCSLCWQIRRIEKANGLPVKDIFSRSSSPILV
jgi:hypothetical protein